MSAPRTNTLNAGYDQSLLAATPEVSRAAKQEGYNVDLLQPRQPRGTTTPRSDPEAVYSKENFTALSPVDRPVARRVPFWQTRGGIIGLAVVAIIIVGAVVGGAVGGTVGNNNKDHNASVQQTKGGNNTNNGQGVGVASNVSAVASPSSTQAGSQQGVNSVTTETLTVTKSTPR